MEASGKYQNESKYDKDTPQSYIAEREEEPQNTNSQNTPGRQLK